MTTDTKPGETMKFEIKNRWSGNVQVSVEIECSADAPEGVKLGLAVRAAIESDANLRGAVLRGAVLRDADLRGADLSGADLGGADLGACPVKIENIHRRVYDAASKPDALDMRDWHENGDFCGTTHCRAGWVVYLAGEGGRALEWAMGTPAAAALIYMASDPKLERIPDFYCNNEAALADMKRLAEQEAANVS